MCAAHATQDHRALHSATTLLLNLFLSSIPPFDLRLLPHVSPPALPQTTFPAAQILHFVHLLRWADLIQSIVGETNVAK